jgi:hypothetical protein
MWSFKRIVLQLGMRDLPSVREDLYSSLSQFLILPVSSSSCTIPCYTARFKPAHALYSYIRLFMLRSKFW